MADKKDSPSHFDDIIKTVSEFGRWQRFIYFTTCALVIVPSGIHIAGLYFVTGTPKFHCATPNTTCAENKCCDNCTEYKFDGPFISTATEVPSYKALKTIYAHPRSNVFYLSDGLTTELQGNTRRAGVIRASAQAACDISDL